MRKDIDQVISKLSQANLDLIREIRLTAFDIDLTQEEKDDKIKRLQYSQDLIDSRILLMVDKKFEDAPELYNRTELESVSAAVADMFTL